MRLSIGVFSLALLFSAVSCTSYKRIPYFQESGGHSEFETQSYAEKSIVRFQPDDILAIMVNVVGEQKIASDYNLPAFSLAANSDIDGSSGELNTGLPTYLISKNGEIEFPTLGILKVAGYTQEELQEHIKGLLRSRMKVEPIVTVKLVNFRITMVGEVGKPGQLTVRTPRIDLFEALALAGDMTIYGKRENVIVRRQLPDGKFRYVKLDLSKADVSASPYFYLRQNDLVYVQPNKVKSLQSDMSTWSFITTVASFIISVATFVTLFNRR